MPPDEARLRDPLPAPRITVPHASPCGGPLSVSPLLVAGRLSPLVAGRLRGVGPRAHPEAVHEAVPVLLARKDGGVGALDDGALAQRDGVARDHAHVALRLAVVAHERTLVRLRPAGAARAH
eukprot:7115786-Pyramimonas_sp.AAC.7